MPPTDKGLKKVFGSLGPLPKPANNIVREEKNVVVEGDNLRRAFETVTWFVVGIWDFAYF